ncbi:helix-turn-helix transcriptional regulator [Nakamurella aerolata]|uniref:WYL domain-containing protein n=1 Tax=Nakamurella aerolata TaxID=1656892 RepID=A0A849A088_9ACTN|nr:WYL domain-containing protein [Nakamurella aerolata]NNG34474.1 WYL domain-containing protein [Nakamurella aerolata]
MSETAAQQLSRVMSMVPFIARRPGVSMTTLAAEYGVGVEQISADLNLLMVCGLPGYYPDDLIDVVLDEEGGTVSMGFQAGLERPVRLTGDEAVALTAALRALADLPGVVDDAAVRSALAKLEGAGAGTGDAVRVVAGDPTDDPATARTLSIVGQAVQQNRRLSIRYYTASRDTVSERVVDPLRLLLTDGHTYLEAYCHTAGATRNFRVDRIDDASLLDEPAQPPLWQETEVPDRMYTPGADASTVVLLLGPGAQWVADYYLVTDVALESGSDGQPTGRLRVTMPAQHDEWLARLVLSLGDAAEIVDRPDLAARVTELAEQALAEYSAPDADPAGS